MSTAVDISLWQLALASVLLLVAIGLSVALKLGLTRGLAVAAARMVVQLLLVGLVLEWVFSTDNALLIVSLAVGMALLAGHAAVRRTSRRYPQIWADALVSVLGASFVVTGAAVLGILRIDPWYDPQYLIPLHGMLLGNALTGISLSLDRFMDGAGRGRGLVEGANSRLPICRTTSSLLVPTSKWDAMRSCTLVSAVWLVLTSRRRVLRWTEACSGNAKARLYTPWPIMLSISSRRKRRAASGSNAVPPRRQ